MARIKRQAPEATAPAGGGFTPAENEAEILMPERDIVLGGESVTVREYTFAEQMKHGELLTRLVDALRPVLPRFATSQGSGLISELLDALAAHADEVLAAIALSTDRSVEWVGALSGEDGEALALTWWQVNQGFFVRRLVLYPALAAQAFAVKGGEKSSPSSSTTVTPGAN